MYNIQGWNNKTTTNLNDDEIKRLKDLFADNGELNPDDYYFIGVDNDGNYYAFSRKNDDGKIYIFSDDAARTATYESFEEFLDGILNV